MRVRFSLPAPVLIEGWFLKGLSPSAPQTGTRWDLLPDHNQYHDYKSDDHQPVWRLASLGSPAVLPRTETGLRRPHGEHVVLRCADGVALIAYAGLALIDAGLGLVEISDWVRESLRGETRLLEPSLVVLRVNATRDLGPLCRHLRLPHMFTIGILAAGVPWIVQIRNFTIDERGKAELPSATFTTHGARVEEGRAFGFPAPIYGSGRYPNA